MIDHKLKQWATARQCEIIDAVNTEGSGRKAAIYLGVDKSYVNRSIKAVQKRAAMAGYSPDHNLTHAVPDGFRLKGASTLYNADGEVTAQWVKSAVDQQRQQEIIKETISAFTGEIEPRKPVKSPAVTNQDILTAYLIGDAHIGMLAWGEETGEDFDSAIASRDILAAADRLIEATPQANECLVVQLGDFYHADDSSSLTPGHHNRVDVDSRFPKVIRTGIQVMRGFIDAALKKHNLVRVRNVAGNHDPHAYITLNEALKGYYSKEPRVIIEDSPKPFYFYRFGTNLIGITHGHAPKPEKLPGLLAVSSGEDWGQCEFKYIWHGHIHNKRVFEDLGVLVESFRTLAGKDAWHVEQGYHSGREMQAIILHKDFGEVERHTAGIKAVRG